MWRSGSKDNHSGSVLWKGYFAKFCLLKVARRRRVVVDVYRAIHQKIHSFNLDTVTAKMWRWLGSCLSVWHHLFFWGAKKLWRIWTAPPSFILLSASPTSIETKCCLLYFGNPKVVVWCFENKICLFWCWLFASSHTKLLPTGRSVLPSKLGCPAATLEAWRSGNFWQTSAQLGFLGWLLEAGKEQGKCRVSDNFPRQTSVLQIVLFQFY